MRSNDAIVPPVDHIHEWDERWVAAALASGKLDQRDERGVTPVWHAVYFSKPDWVTRLLDAGADPNAHDDERIERSSGQTQVVCLWGQDLERIDVPTGTTTLLHVACASRAPDRIVDVLLARGFDVNARDAVGSTPLHIAVDGGHTDVVDRLLRAGADPNIVDCGGYMPLDRAGRKTFGRLLEAGASPDGGPRRRRQLSWCRSIVEACASGDEVGGLQQLRDHGMDVTKHPGAIVLAASRGQTRAVRWLVEAGAPVRGLPADAGYETAIEAAASCGQLETIEALGDRVNDATPDELGRALVAAAAKSANDLGDSQRQAGRIAVYRWLLEHGARVDARDLRDEPLIITAARFGMRGLAELLLAHGADPKTKANDGSSAYEVAVNAYKQDHIDDARFVMSSLANAGGGPPKVVAPPAAPVAKPGSRVTHAKFGGGEITAITGDKWTVKFDTGETRTLVAKVLTLA
jgi:ankyrin repeat protein